MNKKNIYKFAFFNISLLFFLKNEEVIAFPAGSFACLCSKDRPSYQCRGELLYKSQKQCENDHFRCNVFCRQAVLEGPFNISCVPADSLQNIPVCPKPSN